LLNGIISLERDIIIGNPNLNYYIKKYSYINKRPIFESILKNSIYVLSSKILKYNTSKINADILSNIFIMYSINNFCNSILLNKNLSILNYIIKKELIDYNFQNINFLTNDLLKNLYFKNIGYNLYNNFIFCYILCKSNIYINNIINSIDNNNINNFRLYFNDLIISIVKIYPLSDG